MSVSRRSFLTVAPLGIAAGFGQAPAPRESGGPAGPPASFPTQSPDLVREMVTVSHFDPARVAALLDLHATLANASWDWGFGDWEDALGAASHMGNHEIAALLLAHGARPTIFSAAMLGQLDVVKALIAASPGIEATPGPHGITLLRHAINGGPGAEAVAEYLRTVPGADARPDTRPIGPEQLSALSGDYVYGAGADEIITISASDDALMFARAGRPARRLTHVGDLAFFPAGAPRVRIRFTAAGGGVTLAVHDPDRMLEARRIGRTAGRGQELP